MKKQKQIPLSKDRFRHCTKCTKNLGQPRSTACHTPSFTAVFSSSCREHFHLKKCNFELHFYYLHTLWNFSVFSLMLYKTWLFCDVATHTHNYPFLTRFYFSNNKSQQSFCRKLSYIQYYHKYIILSMLIIWKVNSRAVNYLSRR